MKMKKLTAIIMASVMLFGMAACGGKKTDSASGDSAASTTEATTTDNSAETASTSDGAASDKTLSVMIWDSNQEPGINEILADFTAKTGIKTNVQVVKWEEYWTMLEAGATGGNLPDVFWMHSNEAERYMSNGMLLDLTDRIAQSTMLEPDKYPEDIKGIYMHDGKQYAFPKDVDTIALWYNKKLFDEAGVAYPTADWTWNDLYEAAKKLTIPEKEQFGFASRVSNNQSGYFNAIYDEGGFVISEDKKTSGFDDPKTIEAMKVYEKLIKEDLMPSQEIMSENQEDVLLNAGKVAMITQGSWMIAAMKASDYISENCDCVELPKSAATGRRVSIYNGLGWAAAANSANAEEAWKCIEYLGTKEAQLKQAQLGVTMAAYQGISDEWAKSASFNLQAYLNMMNDMVIRPYSKQTVKWENATIEELKKAWTKEVSMEDACKNAAKVMNEILAEE